MIVVCILMLVPFYWVVKTSLTGENIYAYPPRILPTDPHLFNYVDVWYLIPFPRYLLNSVIVSLLAVVGNVVLNAMAAYALTQTFRAKRLVVLLLLSCMLIPFQATIIPAYLITARIGLLNSYLGLALPLLSTIVCIFIYKAAFEAVPRSLIEAARMDGLPEWRIILHVLLPLSRPAIATNVILAFTVDEFVFGFALQERNNFVPPEPGTDRKMVAYVAGLLRGGDYPKLSEMADQMGVDVLWERIHTHGRDRDRFERGLRRLLDGFARELGRRD